MDLEEALKRIKELENKNATLENKNATLESKNVTLENKNATLENKNAELEDKLYRANAFINELLLRLQNQKEKTDIAIIRQFESKTEKIDKIVIDEVEEIVAKQKKSKRGEIHSKKFEGFDFESLVTETRIIEPDELICPKCGEKLIKVTEDISYLVESIPGSLKVVKVITNGYKCPSCNKKDNQLYYKVKDSIFPHSILTPSFASYIAYHKYELGIPFHHLSKHISSTLKIDISKQDLANYMMRSAIIIEPVFEKMKLDLANNETKVIHADETTVVINRQDEENKTRKKNYVYVFSSSYYSKNQINIYEFNKTRNIDQTIQYLKDYKGYLVCDDYSGYNRLRKEHPDIKLARCWAHARRRFTEIVKDIPKENKQSSKAYKILLAIEKLFENEAKYRKNHLNPLQIKEYRNKEDIKIINNIHDLIFNSNPAKSSHLERAIKYVRSNWDDLLTFLEDGHIELTNNIAERAVKPFVIQRKVFQTSGSYDGARYTTILFSIIRTAIINCLDVQKYLCWLLSNINTLPIDDLLPYSEKAKQFKLEVQG